MSNNKMNVKVNTVQTETPQTKRVSPDQAPLSMSLVNIEKYR